MLFVNAIRACGDNGMCMCGIESDKSNSTPHPRDVSIESVVQRPNFKFDVVAYFMIMHDVYICSMHVWQPYVVCLLFCVYVVCICFVYMWGLWAMYTCFVYLSLVGLVVVILSCKDCVYAVCIPCVELLCVYVLLLNMRCVCVTSLPFSVCVYTMPICCDYMSCVYVVCACDMCIYRVSRFYLVRRVNLFCC